MKLFPFNTTSAIKMEILIRHRNQIAFCAPQRSSMRFPAVAVRSKTAAGKQMIAKD